MQEAVKIISESGIWVFLVGVITSIIIGIVKTPIRGKLIDCLEDGEVKTQRENLFDTLVFLSTYVIAFIAAMVYYAIDTKSFSIGEISKLSLPIWLSQSLAYGAWKKLGLKRLLGFISRLIFKDTNKDHKISIDEALTQIVTNIKEGKLTLGGLMSAVSVNLDEVVSDIAKEVEDTEEGKTIKEVLDGDAVENLENKAVESVKEVASVVIGKIDDDTEVIIGSMPTIKF